MAAHPRIAGCATQIDPLLAQFQTQISINFLTWILVREPRVTVIATSRTATFWGSRSLQLRVLSTTLKPQLLLRSSPGLPHHAEAPLHVPHNTGTWGLPGCQMLFPQALLLNPTRHLACTRPSLPLTWDFPVWSWVLVGM